MTQNYINKAVKEFRKLYISINPSVSLEQQLESLESFISQIIADTVKGVREEDSKILIADLETVKIKIPKSDSAKRWNGIITISQDKIERKLKDLTK